MRAKVPYHWFPASQGGHFAILTVNLSLQLRQNPTFVVQTSSYATILDASQNDMSVILTTIVATIQMNTRTAHDQLALPLILLATISVVFRRSGFATATMIVGI